MTGEVAAPHGTRARYQRRGDPCRCAPCRDANADYQRLYRSAGPMRLNGHQLALELEQR